MKSLLIMIGLLFCTLHMEAQHIFASKKRVFFSSGIVTPQYISGNELIRSQKLRTAGQSYFQAENGDRRNTGDYTANTGFSLSIGYQLPISKVAGLSLGLQVNSGQTGANPNEAGYEEGYFFNFLSFGLGAQYFPFASNNWYTKAEVGMGSVFTKNRFINEESAQDFLHHFGIGLSSGIGLGYAWSVFNDADKSIYLESIYQFYQTRVEVSGIGNDNWRFGALHIAVGISF